MTNTRTRTCVRIYAPGELVPSYQGIPAPSTAHGYVVAGGGHCDGPFENYGDAIRARNAILDTLERELNQ